MNRKIKKDAYDATSKRILTNKTILCNIMKECIPEYKGVSKEEIIKCIEYGSDENHILGINNEDIGIKNKTIRFDILFTSKLPNSNERIGMYIDIEPQNSVYLEYELINRAIYYASRLIDRQKGETFNNSNYDDIRKVYSIWICPYPKQEQKDSINYYTFNEECIKGNYHTKADYRKLNIVMLYIGNNYDSNQKGILEMLNLIFVDNTYNSTDKQKKLNNDYDIILSNKEVSDMTNLSQDLIRIGLEQGMDKGIEQGIELGKKRGIELGKKQGIELGEKQGIVKTIINFINSGISKEEAYVITKADDSIKEEVEKTLNNKTA